MRARVFLAALLVAGQPAFADFSGDFDAALARVARLKALETGRTYSLPARGETLTGTSEDFLERREPDEILASGLSSGCGDHAAAFYGLLRATGAQLKYIQAVELSASSLLERFSGHTAVAVQDPKTDRWLLVDPTKNKVLSRDWDLSARVFHSPAGRFWTGYSGPLEEYPAKSPAQLKSLLRRTLRLVPAPVWDKEVPRLDFSADPSIANPRTIAFLERFSAVYDDLGLRPETRVEVRFKDGGPGFAGDCRRSGLASWTCHVGRDAAMDQRWFSWVERAVMRELDQPL